MAEIKLPITLTAAAVSLAQEAAGVIVEAQAYVIETPEQYHNSLELLKRIKGVSQKLEAERTAQKAPILAAGRDVDSLYKAETDKLLKAEKVLKDAALTFQQAEQKKAREEQERLQREAEENARKEQERLLARAAKAEADGKVEKAEDLLEKAEAVTPFVPVVAAPVFATAGVSTRQIWKYRITDVNAIPREYMIPNDTMIGNVVRASKGAIKIAGVEAYAEDSMAVSGR